MNNISLPDAVDLLQKLFSERVTVFAFSISPTGTKVKLSGFLDSMTVENGLVVFVGTPAGQGRAWIAVPTDKRTCDFTYGEVREIPLEMRQHFSEEYGSSALIMKFRDSGEYLVLLFTL